MSIPHQKPKNFAPKPITKEDLGYIADCKPGDLVRIKFCGDKCIILNIQEHLPCYMVTYYSLTYNQINKDYIFAKEHVVHKLS